MQKTRGVWRWGNPSSLRMLMGVGAAILATMLLASCQNTPAPAPPPATQPPAPTPAPAATPTTITWAFWGDPWEIEINQRLVKVFNSDRPDIKINTVSTTWPEYFPQADQWLSGDSPPDVMFFDFVPVYASRGVLENLTPLITRDRYDMTDFYPALLKYHTYQDGLYGIARDNDTKVIFYNKAIFDAAGVPYPVSGWTWDDLRQTAIKLTRKSGGQTTQYGFAYESDEWWRLWVWQNGGNTYDDDFNPTKSALDSPQAIEAIQWLADLTNVDKATPTYEGQKTSMEIGQLFQEGKLAMAFGNHALVPAFAATPGLKWDVVGLPSRKMRVNAGGGSGYVIPVKAKNKEAAWTFLKWLESPKGQAIFTESGVIVPARRSVGRADIFLKQEPPHNAAVFIEETELGRPNPMFKGIQEIATLMDDSLRPVWQGKTTAADAVNKMVPAVNAAIARW